MDQRNRKHSTAACRIQQDMVVSGNMESDKDVLVSGEIRGNVDTARSLSVLTGGMVEGDVRCNGLRLEGCIRGNVRVAGTAVLGSGSTLEGTLSAASLELGPGAKLKGALEFII